MKRKYVTAAFSAGLGFAAAYLLRDPIKAALLALPVMAVCSFLFGPWLDKLDRSAKEN